jgi:hypothetical protein
VALVDDEMTPEIAFLLIFCYQSTAHGLSMLPVRYEYCASYGLNKRQDDE